MLSPIEILGPAGRINAQLADRTSSPPEPHGIRFRASSAIVHQPQAAEVCCTIRFIYPLSFFLSLNYIITVPGKYGNSPTRLPVRFTRAARPFPFRLLMLRLSGCSRPLKSWGPRAASPHACRTTNIATNNWPWPMPWPTRSKIAITWSSRPAPAWARVSPTSCRPFQPRAKSRRATRRMGGAAAWSSPRTPSASRSNCSPRTSRSCGA